MQETLARTGDPCLPAPLSSVLLTWEFQLDPYSQVCPGSVLDPQDLHSQTRAPAWSLRQYSVTPSSLGRPED